MFFVLSQLLDFFTRPSNIVALLAVLGMALILTRRRRLGFTASLVAAALLIVLGWLPSGTLALRVLEERFPQPERVEAVAGIIMLGGAVDTHTTAYREQAALNSAAERITTTMELAQQFPAARIVLSGGGAHISEDGALSESEVARQILVAMGLDQDRIELEEASRNTCENAARSSELLGDPGAGQWLLITSASHMPRAVGCYRAAGLDVLPYPVDYRTGPVAGVYGGSSWSIAEGLAAADLAAHEWLGLLTYRLAGFTHELLPAPLD